LLSALALLAGRSRSALASLAARLGLAGPFRPGCPAGWRLIVIGLVALLALAGGAACGHAQAFDEGVLHKDGVSVRVGPVPPGWRRVGVDGADLAFRDDERSGSALFDMRCGKRDDDAPLGVLTSHLIMGTTEREFDAQDTVPFDGREALHTLLRAKLDGVPMQYDIYVMKKDGCLYDLVYVAPPTRFADGAADFERFAAGVRTEGSPSASSGGAAAAATSARDP
jgi:hypothetical protein